LRAQAKSTEYKSRLSDKTLHAEKARSVNIDTLHNFTLYKYA